MRFLDKHINILVALVLFLTFGAQVLEGIFLFYNVFILKVITLFKYLLIFLLLIYQKRHYGFFVEDKLVAFFFLTYTIYAFFYLTIGLQIPIDKMLAVPDSIFTFIFRSIVIFLLMLCGRTIYEHMQLENLIFVMLIFCAIPSSLYIKYMGVDFLQSYKEDDLDLMFVPLLTIGYTNALIFILCIITLGRQKKQNIFKIIYLCFVIVLTLYIMVVSTKRGPLLWSIITIVVYYFFTNKHLVYYIIGIIIFLSLLWINLDECLNFLSNFVPRTVEQINNSIYNSDTSLRFDLSDKNSSGYIIGWYQFMESPFLGSYFRITKSGLFYGCYPHNLFIEIMITMGLFGLAIFMSILIKISKIFFYLKRRKIWHENQIMCFVLMLFTIFMLMTTGTLFLNVYFWIFISISTSIKREISGFDFCNNNNT